MGGVVGDAQEALADGDAGDDKRGLLTACGEFRPRPGRRLDRGYCPIAVRDVRWAVVVVDHDLGGVSPAARRADVDDRGGLAAGRWESGTAGRSGGQADVNVKYGKPVVVLDLDDRVAFLIACDVEAVGSGEIDVVVVCDVDVEGRYCGVEVRVGYGYGAGYVVACGVSAFAKPNFIGADRRRGCARDVGKEQGESENEG